MYLLIVLVSLAVLYTIYMIAFFAASLLLNVHENHYVLGFGKPLFSFTLQKVKFSIAFFIPIIGLARIRVVVGDKLLPRRYPWQFENASLMKRMAVTIAGPSTLIFAGVVFVIAEVYTTPESTITKEIVNTSGISPSALAREVGFAEGDKVVALNGKDYKEYFELVAPEPLMDSNSTYTVLREGKQIDIRIGNLPEMHTWKEPFFSLHVPFEIVMVAPGSSAEDAGLMPGDRIIKVNNMSIVSRGEMIAILDDDDDREVTLHVLHASANQDTSIVQATLTDDRRLGFRSRDLFEFARHDNTLGEAIQIGTRSVFTEVSSGARLFSRVFFGTVKGSVSGPIGISQAFEQRYARRAASLAVWYFIYNFLPLPLSVLWEIIPLAYEGITRKKYSYKAFDKGLVMGWVVLIGIFVWTFVSDMMKLLG